MTIEYADPEPVTLPPAEVLSLSVQIADAAARANVELIARRTPGGLWDISTLNGVDIGESPEEAQRELDLNARYLDLRGRLVRPLADAPHLVMILPRGVE